MIAGPLPPSLSERTDEEDILRDVESVRGTSMQERAAILVSLCRMAAEQVSQHSDPRRTLEWQDAVSADTERLLADLRRARDASRA